MTWHDETVKGELDVISECEYYHHDIVEKLRSQIAELKTVGEKLAEYKTYCLFCGAPRPHDIHTHHPDCPVTEWQQLVKQIEEG